MMAIEDIYYKEKDTRTTRRLKIDVEPNWFSVMPCAAFYSVLRSTLEFLECSEKSRIYMDFLSEIINENNILYITMYSLM